MKNFIFCAVKKFLTLPQVTLMLLRIFGSTVLTVSFKIFRSSHPEVFCKKGVVKNFAKFTGKHLCWSLFLNKVTGFKTATLLKERIQHKCFPVNFSKLLTVAFFTEQHWWVLLDRLLIVTITFIANIHQYSIMFNNIHRTKIYRILTKSANNFFISIH